MRHTHDDAIATFNLIREAPLLRERLQLLLALRWSDTLAQAAARQGPGLHVQEDPEHPAVVQGAQHLHIT